MRFWLNILISLALIPPSVQAGAKPTKYDYAYRAVAYYYATSPTVGQFLRNLPLKDSAAKENLIRLAEKSGGSRVKPRLIEWNPKARTIKFSIDRKSATVGFVADNSGYFTVNGKRVQMDSGAAIEKTWNRVHGILNPSSSPRKSAWLNLFLPEANAQGIGILEGLIIAAAVTALVVGAAAYANQELVQPAFCTASVDPRKCLRSIADSVKALTEDAVPKVTITGFRCKDKNLAHASFHRDPNENLEYSGTYNPDTVKYITPPALFPMPVEIPVSGGPKSMTFTSYYSETPSVRSKCSYDLDKDFKVVKVTNGDGSSDPGFCGSVGLGNSESLMKVQAGVQFPIDLLMECCRSTVCEEQVTQYVKPAPEAKATDAATGTSNATE